MGIVHTNYFVYASEQPAAFIRAPAMKILCSWMCRAHCHRVIKLSATLDQFAPEKELVENVHGVRREFIDIGKNVRTRLAKKGDPVFSSESEPSVYFIGKMLWSKGIGALMDLIKYAEENADLSLSVDMYGGGPNQIEAKARSEKLGLNMTFHGPVDHAALGSTHKIFINPSTSEVLCTTVAEALAMGKFVIVPNHPSNDFFTQFPNCLTYSSTDEFVGNLYYALTHSPIPMDDEVSYLLSWEAATERLVRAGSLSVAEAEASEEVMSSEFSLPAIIDDEERAKKIIRPIHRTRERYRSFRSRLASEVKQSKVLPAQFQKILLDELDKKLDLDLDTILSEPKLRLKLSPAELDRQLLEFYDNMSKSPPGDLLRIIGGGANVGAQNLYLKQQARKSRQNMSGNVLNGLISAKKAAGEDSEVEDVSPGAAVRRALKRNFRPNLVSKGENSHGFKSERHIISDDDTNEIKVSKSSSTQLNAFQGHYTRGSDFASSAKVGWRSYQYQQERIKGHLTIPRPTIASSRKCPTILI